jgi:anaerobic selenocysteine-containing dehydrogenase
MASEQRRTFCRVCEPACGLLATVEDGQLVRLRGDDGAFERVTWDDATSEIAARLRGILERHGPAALATYTGNPTAFNALYAPGARALFGQLGVRRAFSSGTQDCANKFAGSEAVFGSSTIHPIPDLEHTDYVLILGENPRVSHMSFLAIADPMAVLDELRERGGRVRFVNPRHIESARDASELVQIRPDTDLYLLAAMLCEIERSSGFDEAAVRERGANLEGLRDFVRRFPPERVANATGIPAERIVELARDFANAPSASIHMSTGVNMGRQGTLAYWLVHMLAFVTGNLDRRGGNVLSVGFYPNAKAGRRRYEDGFGDSPHGRLRKGSLPGNLMAEYLCDPDEPVRALFVTAGNPLLSIGGEQKLREAFDSLELLVVIDLYRNATAELADFVLPSTDMFERADVNITGLGLQHRPYVQWSDAMVEPQHERREEWWIFARLCQALGLKSWLDERPAPDLWSRIDHMLRSRGRSFAELRAAPYGLDFGPHEPCSFDEEHLQTADGRVDCCPAGFAAALEGAEQIFRDQDREPPESLKLITKRDPYMHNSWYANLPLMKRGERDRNYLFMHADDAARRGLADGDKVRVRNEHGAIALELKLADDLRPGVVAITHGWGNAATPGMRVAQQTAGENPNRLLPTGPESFDPLSNQAHMTGVPVEVSAAP